MFERELGHIIFPMFDCSYIGKKTRTHNLFYFDCLYKFLLFERELGHIIFPIFDCSNKLKSMFERELVNIIFPIFDAHMSFLCLKENYV